MVVNCREIRNGVGASRLVENKLIYSAATRERIIVTGGENDIIARGARQRQRRRIGGGGKDKIDRVGCAEAVDHRKREHVGRRRGCAGIVGDAGREFCVDGAQKARAV